MHIDRSYQIGLEGMTLPRNSADAISTSNDNGGYPIYRQLCVNRTQPTNQPNNHQLLVPPAAEHDQLGEANATDTALQLCGEAWAPREGQ